MSREQQIAEIGQTGGLMSLMDISVSGMAAQSEKMRVLSELVAQMDSIYEQGKYQKSRVTFHEDLQQALGQYGQLQGGVSVERSAAPASMERIYDPGNPYADQDGFVYGSQVSFAKTVTDWMLANKHFEANLNLYKLEQQMAQQVLDLGR